MNYKALYFLIFIFSISAQSQQIIKIKNSNSYQATNSWDFVCKNYALTGVTSVQIINTLKGGTLKLAIETTDPSFKIAGIVYINLIDNTLISCFDKGIRDYIGKQTISYYTLSGVEVNKLKKNDIQSIRFNITGKPSKFSSQIGYFTAVNSKNYYAITYDKNKRSFDTASEIKALFEKPNL